MQLFGVTVGGAVVEQEGGENGHVMSCTRNHQLSASLKPACQSLERLWNKVERQLLTLEWILASKCQLPSASPDESTSSLRLDSATWVSLVNGQFINVVKLLEKQRQIEKKRIWGESLTADVRGENSPSTAPPLTIGSIYQKLQHRLIARRIINRKPTLFNRHTTINLRGSEKFEEEETGEVWITASSSEKVQRNLRALSIEMSHTALTWKERIFIETNPLGRYGCFQPSYLRWSWTAIEVCGSEEFPEEEF